MSAQARRFPLLSKYKPFDLPALSINKERFPEVSYFQILLLGWSVKNTFPYISLAGPSVKLNCLDIKVGLDPGNIIEVSTLSIYKLSVFWKA
jgi:hypothetical protein